MLDITRPNVVAGFDIALALSADIVPQANNNYGAMLRLTKTGSLFKTKNNKVKETINNEGKVDVKESPKKPKVKETINNEVKVDEKESPKKPKVKETINNEGKVDVKESPKKPKVKEKPVQL